MKCLENLQTALHPGCRRPWSSQVPCALRCSPGDLGRVGRWKLTSYSAPYSSSALCLPPSCPLYPHPDLVQDVQEGQPHPLHGPVTC